MSLQVGVGFCIAALFLVGSSLSRQGWPWALTLVSMFLHICIYTLMHLVFACMSMIHVYMFFIYIHIHKVCACFLYNVLVYIRMHTWRDTQI